MRKITIDEVMTMPIEELSRLIDENSFIDENGHETNSIDIDMCGLSIKDIVEKYGCITMEQLSDNIKRKLNNNI